MSGNVGRADAILKDGSAIAGIREKSIAWSGETVDLTSGEDNGIRKLLDQYGQQQLTVSGSGVYKDDATFRNVALSSSTTGLMTDITYEFSNGDKITGDVILSSYNEGAPYKDATTFDFTLEYTGDWVLVEAP